MDSWYGKNYYSLNAFMRNKFGERVHRVSLDAGFTCPNRDGLLGTGGCVYCNEAGARAGYVDPGISIAGQLEKGIEVVRRKYGADKFIAYFQAYTNTYAGPDRLRKLYNEALSHPSVIGISIGTRPDCVDEEKLDLIEEIAGKYFVILEYGVESMKPETLKSINRGHGVPEIVKAVQETKKRKNINILAHLIFGLPGESTADMKSSVKSLVDLGIDAFKFHQLYVEKGTVLEKMYFENKVRILELQEYLEILCGILPDIPGNVVIHRLFGECGRESLIAPLWTLEKPQNLLKLERLLEKNGIRQGQNC
jgi:uncharacterized protein